MKRRFTRKEHPIEQPTVTSADLPPELSSGMMADTPEKIIDLEPESFSKVDDSELPAPTKQLRRRTGRRKPDPGKSLAVIPANRKQNWRNLLRPRYIKVEDGRVRIVPSALSHQHVTTLSASGGPYFSNSYALPLAQSHLADAEYWPEGNKRGYTVDRKTQWEMLAYFTKTKPDPGIYVISAETRTMPLRQLVFTMLMHTVYALNAKHVKWIGLYSTFKDYLRDEQPLLDALVIGNIHDGMDLTKFTKLRDLLHIYSAIPIFLVVDGVDPLEFAMRHLHTVPKLVLNVAAAKIPHYIRQT